MYTGIEVPGIDQAVTEEELIKSDDLFPNEKSWLTRAGMF